MFYNDTAINGNTPALMCTHDFFGAGHLLFGSDAPYSPQHGELFIRQVIAAIEGMNISDADKKRIYEGNAIALLGIKV